MRLHRLVIPALLFFPALLFGAERPYGSKLCVERGFHCYQIDKHEISREGQTKQDTKTVKRKQLDSWGSLFPDPTARMLVMKLNRMNIELERGMVIAIPDILAGKTLMDFSPFPLSRNGTGEKVLIWDPKLLAWAAYNEGGILTRWGPGVGGKEWCPDIERPCKTINGTFRLMYKTGRYHRSDHYPVGECLGSLLARPGCAPMPWFMCFDDDGYGLHGSDEIPGYNASHGCIRIFTDDAEWLNLNFVNERTDIIILPY